MVAFLILFLVAGSAQAAQPVIYPKGQNDLMAIEAELEAARPPTWLAQRTASDTPPAVPVPVLAAKAKPADAAASDAPISFLSVREEPVKRGKLLVITKSSDAQPQETRPLARAIARKTAHLPSRGIKVVTPTPPSRPVVDADPLFADDAAVADRDVIAQELDALPDPQADQDQNMPAAAAFVPPLPATASAVTAPHRRHVATIQFSDNAMMLDARSRAVLARVAEYYRTNPGMIVLESHSGILSLDGKTRRKTRDALNIARAQAVTVASTLRDFGIAYPFMRGVTKTHADQAVIGEETAYAANAQAVRVAIWY